MSREVNFRLITPVNLGQPGSLEQILKGVSNLGYELDPIQVGDHVTNLYAYWRKLDDQVYNRLDIAYEKGELTFLAFDEENFASFLGSPSMAGPWHGRNQAGICQRLFGPQSFSKTGIWRRTKFSTRNENDAGTGSDCFAEFCLDGNMQVVRFHKLRM